MVLTLVTAVVAACACGAIASILIYRASGHSALWTMGVAAAVALVCAVVGVLAAILFSQRLRF